VKPGKRLCGLAFSSKRAQKLDTIVRSFVADRDGKSFGVEQQILSVMLRSRKISPRAE